MRLPTVLIPGATFATAAALCVVVAGFTATAMERASESAVRRSLDIGGFEWAEVAANGLNVFLEGTAPDEASRFAALSQAGGVVDASRIIDRMQVTPSRGIAPPQFSIEILRNDSGISLIGLAPKATERTDVIDHLRDIVRDDEIADFLETTTYATPRGWKQALDYGLKALDLLPSSKISIKPGAVAITANTNSPEDKARLERQLSRMAPGGLRLALDLKAPRPVITPFTLRFTLDEQGGRFDACSAENASSAQRIVAAAQNAGLKGDAECVIGMGVPSPNWAQAVEESLKSLAELGQGSVTLANADITLVAVEGTDQGQFDRIAGALEHALPKVFALHTVLPVAETESEGENDFTATLSPEGQVLLRGRLSDQTQRELTNSFAKARFGSENVHSTARLAEDLPMDWNMRVLTGLEALSVLHRGAVNITPQTIELRGASYQKDASAEVAKLFSTRLGETATYDLTITYDEPPIPENQPLSPEQCQDLLTKVQENGKITFEPGSATVAEGSNATLDLVAGVLEDCGPVRLEIQGHTDSQGRETMNERLSQARAQSVLNELRARRIPTLTFVARGYGEAQPIADNETEEGREANRRIVFQMLDNTAAEAEDSAADETSQETEEGSNQ